MTSNKFIYKTSKGVKVLTVNDIKYPKGTISNLVMNDKYIEHKSIALLSSNSHIIIAATNNEILSPGRNILKRRIHVMKKQIAEI